MGQAIAFYTLAAFILGFAVLVVTTKDTVHSVLFLVLDFLFVAALYVLLGAPFLAAIQILVYAGGIVASPAPAFVAPLPPMPVSGNTEEVGWLLYTSYLIPFEIASMLLLVAMIGAILLAKREL
jgi:NADH-quinone oxidoreductase subunit J